MVKQHSADIGRGLLKIAAIMAALQALRFGLKTLIFQFVERTYFTDRVASMLAMSLLIPVILAAAKAKKIELTVFPKRFGPLYTAATAAAAALLALTPVLTHAADIQTIVLLLYACVVTPIFEELIFRGYAWNRLKALFKTEWAAYLASTVLFALWHYGYVDALAFRVESGLAAAMLWKAVTGLCFGVVLGALRLKTHNCYSTMLLHGVMNLLGR